MTRPRLKLFLRVLCLMAERFFPFVMIGGIAGSCIGVFAYAALTVISAVLPPFAKDVYGAGDVFPGPILGAACGAILLPIVQLVLLFRSLPRTWDEGVPNKLELIESYRGATRGALICGIAAALSGGFYVLNFPSTVPLPNASSAFWLCSTPGFILGFATGGLLGGLNGADYWMNVSLRELWRRFYRYWVAEKG